MNKYFSINGKLLRIRGRYAFYDPDAFEWYTLTEDDCTYLAQSGWNRTIIQTITTTEENIIVPNTLAGYPVNFTISIPSSVKRIKFADGGYNSVAVTASNNSTLIGVYNIPSSGVNKVELTNCTALKIVELDKVENVSGTFRINGCTALENLTEVSADYIGTSLNRLWFANHAGDISKFTVPDAVTNMDYALYQDGVTAFTIDASWDHLTSYANAINNNPLTDVYIASMTKSFDSAWTRGGCTIGGSTWFDGVSTTRSGDILRYSTYDAAPVTVHCYYGSDAYDKIRYAQASQNYMMRNLRLSLIDRHPIRQISFWGDSLTRRNENTTVQSNFVEHFYNWVADDVWCWNMGHGGAGSGTTFPKDYGSQKARWRDDLHVIWIGTNDTILTEEQTIVNIQTMITTCGFNNNYIVLQPFGWGYAEGNEALYEQAFPGITINTHRYIIEHGFDVLGREPTATEQEQLDNNTIPDVFVDTSDMTHITDSGGLCIATAVKEKLLSLGYIDGTWLETQGGGT